LFHLYNNKYYFLKNQSHTICGKTCMLVLAGVIIFLCGKTCVIDLLFIPFFQ